MPNRLFQGIINQMREVLDRTIGVVDESGTVIACSELGQIGEARKGIISAGVFSGAQICVDNCTYKAFGNSVHPDYAVFVDGTDDMSKHYAAPEEILYHVLSPCRWTKSSRITTRNLIVPIL